MGDMVGGYDMVRVQPSGRESEPTPGDRGGWRSLACCGHGVAKSWTRLSD